jgi:hypothetical protein
MKFYFEEGVISGELETSYTLDKASVSVWDTFMKRLHYYQAKKDELHEAGLNGSVADGIGKQAADIVKYLVPFESDSTRPVFDEGGNSFQIYFGSVNISNRYSSSFKPVVKIRFPERAVIALSSQLHPHGGGSFTDAVGVLLRIASPFSGIQVKSVDHENHYALHVAPASKLGTVIDSSKKIAEKLAENTNFANFVSGFGARIDDEIVSDVKYNRDVLQLLRFFGAKI